jgi:PAS domain-containing protein
MAHAQRIDTAVERYRLFVESSPLIPWEADAQTWQFTYVGPQAEDVLGSRVVEEGEIFAVPDRIGSEVQRSASRQVAVRCPGLSKERQNRPLKVG